MHFDAKWCILMQGDARDAAFLTVDWGEEAPMASEETPPDPGYLSILGGL
jgi:hypothetical protein